MVNEPLQRPAKFPYHLVLIFFVLSVLIIITGYLYYKNQQKNITSEKQQELAAIADLKIQQIISWRNERLGDAGLILATPTIGLPIHQYLRGESISDSRRTIQDWLTAWYRYYGYKNVVLLDAGGTVRLAVPDRAVHIGPSARQCAAEALRTRKVVFSGLHRGVEGDIHIDVLAPVISGAGKEARPIGILLLRIDPYKFLYPLIQFWPTSSPTGETLLVRREGDKVVFLNELRHRKNTAFSLSFPINDPRMSLPAAAAARGYEGFFTGIDYRGVPVLAAIKKIPDSPWILIAKVDAEEVYAPVRRQLWYVLIVMLLLLLITAGILATFWRREQFQSLQKQHAAELEHLALMQHYAYMSRYSNDISILFDKQFNIVEANERAESTYGYTREELLNKNLRDLRPPETNAFTEKDYRQVLEKGSGLFETINQRKDGTTFPVEVSARIIEIAGIKFCQGIARDITERKKNEQALRESEKRFKAIADYTVDWENWVDTDGHLLWVNPSVERITGYTPQECRAMPDYPLPIIHPDDRESLSREFTKATRGDHGENVEFRLVRKDGTMFWGSVSYQPIFDSAGRPLGHRSSIRDITGQKQAVEALQQERNFTARLIETSPAFFVTIGSDGKTMLMNEAMCASLGYERREVLGSDYLSTFVPAEEREGLGDYFQSLSVVNDWIFHRNGVLARDGSIRMVDWNGRAVFKQDGSLDYIYGIGIDITKRQKTEDALRESEEQFRLMAESISDGLTIIGENKPIYVNNRVCEITGYSTEELQTMKTTDIAVPEHRPLIEEAHKRFMEAGTLPLSLEFEIIRKDGFRRFVSNRYSASWQGDRIISRYVLTTDITERKKAEEERERLRQQLIQSQKMEAIGHLTGGIAHDFNNILSAIIGYANLTELKMREDEPLRANIQQILSSSERAANLVRSLLAFSRKQLINPKPVRLDEIVLETEKMLQRIIGEDIELRSSLSGKDIVILADAGQISQILINLATNARDAMPGGGTLSISTVVAEIDDGYIAAHGFGVRGSYGLLTITDTGTGMDEKTRSQIFEPFFTTKEVGKGTGLGLSTAYGIVKQHNGFINCYSEPGQGTTFKVYLPLIEITAEQKAAPEQADPLIGGTETILMAEDERIIRDLNRNMLEKFGYRVIEAEDGEDAIKKFREHQNEIQLLLLDVVMPKKNGREVFETIQKLQPNIKALFMSGYTADIMHNRGVVEEGFTMISKPVTMTALLKAVRDELDR